MENILLDRSVTVVEMARSYDGQGADSHRRLDELLKQQVESSDPPLIVLDLSRTASMDSTLLGVMFAAEKRLRARQGHLAVCGANVFCADILRVVNLNSIFPSFATREEAVAGLLAAKPRTD